MDRKIKQFDQKRKSYDAFSSNISLFSNVSRGSRKVTPKGVMKNIELNQKIYHQKMQAREKLKSIKVEKEIQNLNEIRSQSSVGNAQYN